jgi:hypothetical protein
MLIKEQNSSMKSKILLIGAVIVLGLTGSIWAADVTGKWVAQIEGRQGTQENTFNFTVNGTALTGTMSSARGENEITEGKVEGDEISFVIVRSFAGNEMKLLYKGKVSGDEITFTREFQGGPPGGGMGGPPGRDAGAGGGGPRPPREFVAKRVK